MNYLLAAAVLAVGLYGVSAGSASADKAINSDPVPIVRTPSTIRTDKPKKLFRPCRGHPRHLCMIK